MKKPAKVKFIGNENDYILGCDDKDYHYCKDCGEKSSCTQTGYPQFSYGKIYDAYFLEYWQSKRDSLHVKDNDGMIVDFIPFGDFKVLEDPDNVLNLYEATVLCTTHDYNNESFDIKYGKEYKAIGRDKDGYYLVKDESCDCYFYPADDFEIIKDPNELLNHCSLYYSLFPDSSEEPDYVTAHDFCSNHKPQLEKDSLCGCFCCLTIFHPSEIKEWVIADNDCDRLGTALCPYCGIDSVIGASSGYPITKEFLRKMKRKWF